MYSRLAGEFILQPLKPGTYTLVVSPWFTNPAGDSLVSDRRYDLRQHHAAGKPGELAEVVVTGSRSFNDEDGCCWQVTG